MGCMYVLSLCTHVYWRMGELTVVCRYIVLIAWDTEPSVFLCNRIAGRIDYAHSALCIHGCRPCGYGGPTTSVMYYSYSFNAKKKFSICEFWYPRRVLEPMPHGYQGTTALLNCKSCPRFEWIILCPVRGLSKDRRAYGVGICYAQDIDLASVIRAEWVREGENREQIPVGHWALYQGAWKVVIQEHRGI